jgi:hypothetical protein
MTTELACQAIMAEIIKAARAGITTAIGCTSPIRLRLLVTDDATGVSVERFMSVRVAVVPALRDHLVSSYLSMLDDLKKLK